MSVAIVSSARTMSLFCKVLAPPSADRPQRLYAPRRYRNGLESLYARRKERDRPVDRRPPDVRRRGLARGRAGVLGLCRLGFRRADGRSSRGREPCLRHGRAALDPPDLSGLARWDDAYHHRARLLLGRAAAPGRGRLHLLPEGLEALRHTPPGLDRRELRANTVLKSVFQRARPELFDSGYQASFYSFPSGHATVAVGFYGMLTLVLAYRLR